MKNKNLIDKLEYLAASKVAATSAGSSESAAGCYSVSQLALSDSPSVLCSALNGSGAIIANSYLPLRLISVSPAPLAKAAEAFSRKNNSSRLIFAVKNSSLQSREIGIDYLTAVALTTSEILRSHGISVFKFFVTYGAIFENLIP